MSYNIDVIIVNKINPIKGLPNFPSLSISRRSTCIIISNSVSVYPTVPISVVAEGRFITHVSSLPMFAGLVRGRAGPGLAQAVTACSVI